MLLWEYASCIRAKPPELERVECEIAPRVLTSDKRGIDDCEKELKRTTD